VKILIAYFSGTGNTARISELLCKEFIHRGELCDIMPIEEMTLGRTELSLEAYDLVGLGYPVHALDAPQLFYDFISMLSSKRQSYFLFKTAGSTFMQGGSSFRIRSHIANLGWRLKYEELFVMPANMFYVPLPGKVEKLYDRALIQIPEMVDAIISNRKKLLPDNEFLRLGYLFAFLEKRGCRNISRKWSVNDKCTLCGLCVRKCPTGNIRIVNGKLVFADSCNLCLRCHWICPARAIKQDWLEIFLPKTRFVLPD